MEKKVCCIFGQQCKVIKFTPRPNISDLDVIKEKISDICARDTILKMASEQKNLVLQIKDPDIDVWVDVEEDDVVADKSKINVIFISAVKHEEVCSKESFNFEYLPLVKEHELPMNATVVYTEPLDHNNDKIVTDFDTKDLAMPSTSSAALLLHTNRAQPNKSSAFTLPVYNTPGHISVTTPLPPLTFDLNNKVKNLGILAAQKNLIYHWGSYLWEETAGNPTKSDYFNLATNVVKEYPSLATNDGGSTIVRSALSSWIRNHRTTLKKQELKRNSKGEVLIMNASLVNQGEDGWVFEDFDVENALKELQKKKAEGNTPHIRRLLKITFPLRRSWVEKDAKSIRDVINKYPHLANDDLIIFEFLQLKSHLTRDQVFENISRMLGSLAIFFDATCDTSVSKICIINKLNKQLTKRANKNTRKIKPLFSTQEVQTSTAEMISEEGESPRCVVYIDDEEINDANIVADTITIQIGNPSAEKILFTLLAVYYIWDTVFPGPYKNTLEFLDQALIGTQITNHVVLKFLREITNKE